MTFLRLGLVTVVGAMVLELATFLAAVFDADGRGWWSRFLIIGHVLLWIGFAALLLAPRVRSPRGRHAQVALALAAAAFEVVAVAKVYAADEPYVAGAFAWVEEAYALSFGALALGVVASPLSARSARTALAGLAVCVVGAGAYATYRGSDLYGTIWQQAAIVAAVLVAAGALPRRA